MHNPFSHSHCSTAYGAKLRQVEAERGVGNDIATLGCGAYTAPQVAMYVHDLVPLFDPAVLAPIEPIPVTHGRFIDVAVRPAAAI